MTTSPSTEEPFNPDAWLATAANVQRTAQKAMDLDLMLGDYAIDEVSILFKTRAAQNRFVGWAMAKGMQHFNTVEHDIAQQLYGNSLHGISNVGGPAFGVSFDFLRHRGSPWRVECMVITDGWAQLHDPLPEGACVHASFKLPDEGKYEEVLRAMDRDDDHFPMMAEYRNSYGRFAYFGLTAPYFKPRVNLRDT